MGRGGRELVTTYATRSPATPSRMAIPVIVDPPAVTAVAVVVEVVVAVVVAGAPPPLGNFPPAALRVYPRVASPSTLVPTSFESTAGEGVEGADGDGGEGTAISFVYSTQFPLMEMTSFVPVGSPMSSRSLRWFEADCAQFRWLIAVHVLVDTHSPVVPGRASMYVSFFRQGSSAGGSSLEEHALYSFFSQAGSIDDTQAEMSVLLHRQTLF